LPPLAAFECQYFANGARAGCAIRFLFSRKFPAPSTHNSRAILDILFGTNETTQPASWLPPLK
jgi:hypothetical protein